MRGDRRSQPPEYNGQIDRDGDHHRTQYNYHQHRIEHRRDEIAGRTVVGRGI
jgi:hypothetical protein